MFNIYKMFRSILFIPNGYFKLPSNRIHVVLFYKIGNTPNMNNLYKYSQPTDFDLNSFKFISFIKPNSILLNNYKHLWKRECLSMINVWIVDFIIGFYKMYSSV